MSARTDTDVHTMQEVRATLFTEARLIDERDLEGWVELFTQDCIYWLPITGGDPAVEPSIIYDDRARMEERVFRLLDTPAHAQSPPSRTQHDLSNIEVIGERDGELDVRCNMTLHEIRVGDTSQVGLGTPRIVAGRCTYRLRRTDDGLRIAYKQVDLLDREQPQYNLTFVI